MVIGAATQERLDIMSLPVVRPTDGVFADQILGARDRQEDAVAHRSFNDGNSLLVVLADGMGGHQGGEVASRTSVDAFITAFFAELSSLKTSFRLFGSLERANKELEAIGKKNSELEGMGSTLVAATFSPSGMCWISVGDSLLLRVRGRKLQRLNADHSMAPVLDEAVKKGAMTQELAATHRDRNALRSALTGAAIELVDVRDRPEPLAVGDVILLASDGVLTLADDEIVRVVRAQKSAGARAIVSKLLEGISNKNKRRQDNATIAAIVIHRSSNRDVVSRDRSRRAWVIGTVAAALFAFIGFSVGRGVSPFTSIVELFSTLVDQVRRLEGPSRELATGDNSEPQPVDLSEPANSEIVSSATISNDKLPVPSAANRSIGSTQNKTLPIPSADGKKRKKPITASDVEQEPFKEKSLDSTLAPAPSAATDVEKENSLDENSGEERGLAETKPGDKKSDVSVISSTTPSGSVVKTSIPPPRPRSTTSPESEDDEKANQN